MGRIRPGLIVNADDWGSEPHKTDAITSVYGDGAISSASAMVFMEDSERAARLKQSKVPPLGLHINLTQPFTDGATPLDTRQRQEDLIGHFSDLARSRRSLHPSRWQPLRIAIADQMREFRRLYGRDPVHLDGHEHVHLCLDVLASLRPGLVVRPPVARGVGVARSKVSAYAMKRAVIAIRFRVVSVAYDLDALDEEDLERVVASAGHRSVEVICHPDRIREAELLRSPRWNLLVSRRLAKR